MKFGKEFRTHLEETLPEWRDKFLCYKLLKKLLKHFPDPNSPTPTDHLLNFLPPHQRLSVEGLSSAASSAAGDGSGPHQRNLVDLQDWFVRILNEELEKFNDFYVDKEEDFVIRFQELKQRIERVREKSSRAGVLTSESEFSEEMMEIRMDFVAIHGEMVLLKNYSSLNFAGLIKILKKYDKRTGGLLRLPFTQLAVRQPFFTTEPLTRLVRECEANLELLFPLEAEVVEPTPAAQPDSNQQQPQTHSAPTNPSDVAMDLYRSTLAAMRAISSLQKESSTNNPLSFSTLFRSQDDEGTGAVTDENSGSYSTASLHYGEQADEGESHSPSPL